MNLPAKFGLFVTDSSSRVQTPKKIFIVNKQTILGNRKFNIILKN